MLIVCPSCATTYSLTEAQLGRGRTLRCANCRHTWPAAPEEALEAAGAVPALAAAAEAPAASTEAVSAPGPEALPPEAEAPRRTRPRAKPRPRKPPHPGIVLLGRLKS